jgi:hypothetical protein
VFLQELIGGKGILNSIADGDASGTYALGCFSIILTVLFGRFVAELPGGRPLDHKSKVEMELDAANKVTGSGITVSRMVSLDGIFDPNSQQHKFNYNDGRSPFGMKKNAEIWNGRVAQVG